MNEERDDNRNADPRRDALNAEWLARLREGELGEASAHESLDRRRAAYDSLLARKVAEADAVESIELGRQLTMRRHRADLDGEATAAHDVALRAFALLGINYVPGKTREDDLYRVPPLPRAEAARRAGVPCAAPCADWLMRILKYAGMLGCLLLGTCGLGTLVLHVPPRSLPHSPLLPLALGLGCVLVGGAYLAVVPAARRHGSLSAEKPGSREAGRSFASLCALTAGVALSVALADAKALAALDRARALVDPESVPPFAVTLLVACALSAAYVLGAAVLGVAEGFSGEAEGRISAEREKHAEGWKKERAADLRVQQACESLAYAGAVEKRREGLDEEIDRAGQGLRRSLGEAYGDVGDPPELRDGERAQLRDHGLRAGFAALRLAAHERHRGNGSQGGKA